MIKPDVQPVMTMKMIQLTIAQGISSLSPVAFVYFGNLLASQGDISEGCRYVRIAQKLLAKTGPQEISGEVIGMATQTLCYVQPLQSLVDCHREGHDVAMAAGDVHFALLNMAMKVGALLWSSTKLPTLKQEYANARKSFEEHGHLAWVSHTIYQEKAISMLMGTTDNSLNATLVRVEKYLEQNPHASRYVYSQKLHFSFIMRDYDEMKTLAEKFIKFDPSKWILLLGRVKFQSFYCGLVAWWIYRQTKDADWAARGCKSKYEMKKWSESSEHNFLHHALLLEAEEAFSNMNVESAKALYEKAISMARQHR